MRFHDIRINALNQWLKGTNRFKIYEDGLELDNCIECDFQEKYCSSESKHNALFCGLKIFGDSLTNLLEYNIADDLDINDLGWDKQDKLMHYYIPVFLLIETIIDDFNHIEGFKISKLLNDLKGFINKVFKHTNKKHVFLHKYNHHLDLKFEQDEYLENYLSLKSYSRYNGGDGGYEGIGIPKLEYVINLLIQDGYLALDSKLESDESFLKKIQEIYE